MTHNCGFLPRGAVLAVVLTMFAPSSAAAQTPAPNPASGASGQGERLGSAAFASLAAGKSIVVTLADGREYEGLFTISPNALISRDTEIAMTVPFDQIVLVQKSSYRIRIHTLIGLSVGAGVGIWVGCRDSGSDCSGEPWWILAAGFGGGIGAGIGAGVGGILNRINHDNDIIFDARRRTTSMTFAPILSPTRRGVVFSMTWR